MNFTEEQNNFMKYLEKKGKSFNTIKNYRTDLNIFAKFLTSKGHNLQINEISFDQIEEYQSFLEKKYTAVNSIRRRVQALRLFFDYLIEHNKFDQNPIKKMASAPKNVKPPSPVLFPDVLKLHKFLSEKLDMASGFEKVLAQRNLLMFHLIYDGNLKVSDLEKLREGHILTKSSPRVMIVPEKREPYTIPLTEHFNKIFFDYQASLEEQKNLDQIDFDHLLFNGNPYKILRGGLSARGIEILFKDWSEKLELNLTARGLRQSCIFKWLSQSTKSSTIKEWMGVQPQYSLSPYQKLIKDDPASYTFKDID